MANGVNGAVGLGVSVTGLQIDRPGQLSEHVHVM